MHQNRRRVCYIHATVVSECDGNHSRAVIQRQPEIYGYSLLADVERDCRAVVREVSLELVFQQNNREYELIDWIQETRGKAVRYLGIEVDDALATAEQLDV